MGLRRRQLRTFEYRFFGVAVEPVLTRFITADYRMPGGLFVGSGVLAGRVVTAANVTALRTPPQMEPPSFLFLALHAPGAGGWNSGIDAWYGFHGGLL